MAGSTSVGRQGSTGTFTNTIAPKSAEQAMLLKMDDIVDSVNAMATQLNSLVASLAGAADVAAINAAAAALTALATNLEKVALVR